MINVVDTPSSFKSLKYISIENKNCSVVEINLLYLSVKFDISCVLFK